MEKIPNSIKIQNIEDFVPTTSSVPSYVPRSFYDQFRIYNSKNIRQLYWYDTKNNDWNKSVTPATQTVSDDASVSLTPPDNFGKILVHDGNAEVGEFLFDISSGSITEVADLNGNFATSTSSLSGTTGTDGNITVSADSSNTQIDIENRLGGSRDITYLIQQ
jgi:hypothetical protein